MKSRKKKGRCNRKFAKLFSEGDVVDVSSHKIVVNTLCKKGTQTNMFVELCYGVNFFNSRELSFLDQILLF